MVQATHITGVISSNSGIDGVLGLDGMPGSSLGDPICSEPNVWTKNVITLWLENQLETSDNGTEGAIIMEVNYDPLHCNCSYSVANTNADRYQFTTTRFQINLNGHIVTDSKVNRQTVLMTTSPYISVPKNLVIQILIALGLDANTTTPAVVPCSIAGSFNLTLTTIKGREVIQSINMIVPIAKDKCILALTVVGLLLAHRKLRIEKV